MKLEIIRATKGDAEEMGFVHVESWQKAYRGIIPDKIIDSFTPEKQVRIFKEAIATRPEEYYLFNADGRSAGIALLHRSHEANAAETEGEIYAIYFHPDFWGTPATHKGFQFCFARLAERGFRKINIWVLEDNIRARKFYEKYGFRFDGTKQHIDLGKPLVEIRYSKSVPETVLEKQSTQSG